MVLLFPRSFAHLSVPTQLSKLVSVVEKLINNMYITIYTVATVSLKNVDKFNRL